eukprot:COSAG01_NODE_1241_length_11085_cov_9.712361_23_plen_39_part_00
MCALVTNVHAVLCEERRQRPEAYSLRATTIPIRSESLD